MSKRPDDLCAAPVPAVTPPAPLAPPLYLTSVYRCQSLDEAQRRLDGTEAGYVYQRDGHPNADQLAAKCGQLHGADWTVIAGSGMSALATAILAYCRAGEHLVVGNQLYGRSLQLLTQEADRFGISATVVDTCDLQALADALRPETRLVVVETISNPSLRVAPLASLAELVHRHGAQLLVDNTFASPVLCRPLQWGADLVLESISKMINGHSDVMLGLLAGRGTLPSRVPQVLSTWGLASSPFDCWLSLRGISTLHLRMDRACATAQHVAECLQAHAAVAAVHYPGLPTHPDHALALQQLDACGSVVTFHLRGGRSAAERFIAAAGEIPFCPSLGETSTTLSHPASTSHRGLNQDQQQQLGIFPGTIRLSIGTESTSHVTASLAAALDAI